MNLKHLTGSENKEMYGNSLAVQWLGLHASTAEGKGSIPHQGTKIRMLHGQKKRKKDKKTGHVRYRSTHLKEVLMAKDGAT